MDQSQDSRQPADNNPVKPFGRPHTVIIKHLQDEATHPPSGMIPRSNSFDRAVVTSGNRIQPTNLAKPGAASTTPTSPGFVAMPTLTGPLPLQHFSTTYASRLPLMVVVHSGEYRDRNQTVTVGVNDRLALQHLQNIRLVKLQGVLTKHNFSVPLSSNTSLSLLYPANSDSIHSSVFKKVSHLIAAKTLPKVVCATRAWSNGSVSIRSPEILVPIERVQNGTSSAGLLVFSMADREEKLLPEGCTGNFDTSPKMVSMLLQDVVAHVPRVFSSTAYIDDPSRSNNKYVMIMGLDLEVTLRCTILSKPSQQQQQQQQSEFDLPITGHDLRVCVTEWGQKVEESGTGDSGSSKGHASPGTSPSDDLPAMSGGPLTVHSDDSGFSSVNSVNSSNPLLSSQDNTLTSPPQQHEQAPSLPAPSLAPASHGGLLLSPSLPHKGVAPSPTTPQEGQPRGTGGTPSEGGGGDNADPSGAPPLSQGDSPSSLRPDGTMLDSQEEGKVPPPPPPMRLDDFMAISPPISLLELVRQYQTSLPIHVRVQVGRGRGGTPDADHLTIQHVRYQEVVGAITLEGIPLDLPLCTNMRFSILYDPTQDLKAAIKGFLFRGVPTLVSTSPRPPVVWVREGWRDAEGCGVDKDEILLPRKYRPEQEGLAVYSLGTRSEKLLPLACTAVFSTNASHTMLHLCDIVAYAPNAFPCKACIIKDSSATKCFPSNVVTLRSKSVASVLVCSALSPRGALPEEAGLPPVTYYVPLTLPHVELVVMEPSKNGAGPSETKGTDTRLMSDVDSPVPMSSGSSSSAITKEAPPPSDHTPNAPTPSDNASKAHPPSDHTSKTSLPSDDTSKAPLPSDHTSKTPLPSDHTSKAPLPSDSTSTAPPPLDHAHNALSPLPEILPSPITKSPLHSLEGVAVIQPPAAFKEDVSSGDEDEDSGQLTVSL